MSAGRYARKGFLLSALPRGGGAACFRRGRPARKTRCTRTDRLILAAEGKGPSRQTGTGCPIRAFDPIGDGGGIFRRLRTAEFGPQIRLIKRRRAFKAGSLSEGFRTWRGHPAYPHVRRTVHAGKGGIICIFGTGRRDVPCASCRRFQKRPLCLRRAGPAYRRAQAVRPAFLPRYR